LIRAQAAKPSPKAPKAGAAGAAPKEDKEPKEGEEGEEEELDETPEERKARIAAENRAKVAEELNDEELTAEAIERFQLFIDGADLETPEDVQLFARLGFIDIGSKGEVRLSTDGRRFMAAANKGDVRAAKDALSRAREGVAIEDPDIEDLPPDARGGPEPGQPGDGGPEPFRKSIPDRLREFLGIKKKR
jgi:hypothetical protein